MSEQCRDCESELLTWDYYIASPASATGLVRLGECTVMMFLGCDECSATVLLMTMDDFLTNYHPVAIKELT